jgi:hypothetical protein
LRCLTMQFSKPQSDRQHLLAAAFRHPNSPILHSFKNDSHVLLCRIFLMLRESLGKQSFSIERRFFVKTMHRAFSKDIRHTRRCVTNDEVVRALENRHNRVG